MIGRSLVALSILGAAGLLVACGDSGTSAGGGDQGGNDQGGSDQGGNNIGAGDTGGENVGAGPQGGNGPDDCGNGTVDAGEDCDGSDLNGNDCADVGFDDGDLACNADCSYDTSGCTDAACGDGAINGNEDCDGALLGGATCVSEGFDGGALACSGTCAFDTSDCVNISCGDGIINGTEDCDGAALGVGTCATEGFDGGTIACAANCSYNTAGCLNENCVDTIDNDGDAMIDCLDANCAAECADACLAGSIPTVADPSTTTGDTTGHADVFDASCPADFGGTGGGEIVYQATAAVTGVLEITLTSTADLGVSAWTACGTGEITCDDSNGGGVDEFIEVAVTAGDVVFIGVEGYQPAISGPFTLDVASEAIVCGDSDVDPGEECDDGNTAANDGCSATCQDECGDGTCGPNESYCNCAADCTNVATACESCECGQVAAPGNTCACDDLCIQFGDCCANETASCGVDSVTFSFSSSAAPVAFLDGAYTGTLATMACMPIPTISEGTVTSVNSVTVAAAHTWLGDITFKLVSPTGTVVTLMSLPGVLEALDNGAGSSGESSNLAVANPITFIATAATSAESMGSTIPTGGVVCAPAPAGDGICQFIPNAGAAAAGTLATGFTGQTSTGTWQLCAGDSVSTDTGTLNSVTVNITIGG